MNNYLQPGDDLTFAAPTGGVTVGVPVLINGIFVVPKTTAAVGVDFAGCTRGVFTLAKKASETWAEGDVVYWDSDEAAAGLEGQFRIGVVAENGAASAATTGPVRLDGTSIGAGVFLEFHWVFDATGGVAVGVVTLAGPTVPDNCTLLESWYEVATTFTSAGDTATIGLGLTTDDATGIVAAIAINNGGNPWDAGWHDGIQDGTAANVSTKTTGKRAPIATVAVQDLTAGKLHLFARGVVTE